MNFFLFWKHRSCFVIFLPQFIRWLDERCICENDFPSVFSWRSQKFCLSYVVSLKQFLFCFFRTPSRIILQSVETGLITQKQLNLCLWGWIDKMKNRVFRYITLPNITSLCLVAFNSTPFNAFDSSGHKSFFFIFGAERMFFLSTIQNYINLLQNLSSETFNTGTEIAWWCFLEPYAE